MKTRVLQRRKIHEEGSERVSDHDKGMMAVTGRVLRGVKKLKLLRY